MLNNFSSLNKEDYDIYKNSEYLYDQFALNQ